MRDLVRQVLNNVTVPNSPEGRVGPGSVWRGHLPRKSLVTKVSEQARSSALRGERRARRAGCALREWAPRPPAAAAAVGAPALPAPAAGAPRAEGSPATTRPVPPP